MQFLFIVTFTFDDLLCFHILVFQVPLAVNAQLIKIKKDLL